MVVLETDACIEKLVEGGQQVEEDEHARQDHHNTGEYLNLPYVGFQPLESFAQPVQPQT